MINKFESHFRKHTEDLFDWEKEGPFMEIVHKDDDSVMLYEGRTKTAIYIDLDRVSVESFAPGMASVIIAVEMYDTDMIQLHNDGITIDGTFVGFDLVPALAEGVPLKNIHRLGFIYT